LVFVGIAVSFSTFKRQRKVGVTRNRAETIGQPHGTAAAAENRKTNCL
jgi:hypothetical protein